MEIHPIRNDEDHARALERIDALWGAAPGSPEGEELEVLVMLVDDFEARHHAIEPPDPIDAILFRMHQLGLTRADLEPLIGGRGRVSEVLNRKRGLSLAMIRRLNERLGIPAEILIRCLNGPLFSGLEMGEYEGDLHGTMRCCGCTSQPGRPHRRGGRGLLCRGPRCDREVPLERGVRDIEVGSDQVLHSAEIWVFPASQIGRIGKVPG